MKPEEYNIPKEKLQFRSENGNSHDQKFETKPVSYLKDAWYRFKKNKASIAASIIIGLLILFAIFVPMFSKYKVSYSDDAQYPFFADTLPKSKLFSSLGLDFWDGCKETQINESTYWDYVAIKQETGHEVIKNNKYEEIDTSNLLSKSKQFKIRENSYYKKGAIYKNLTDEEYYKLQNYQDRTGNQVILPYYDGSQSSSVGAQNPNRWYKTKRDPKTGAVIAALDSNNELIPLYAVYDGTDNYTSNARIEGDEKLYNYAFKQSGGYKVRVSYYDYYIYYHQEVLMDGVKEPCFLFGTTNSGQDILTCLASGARFSFILSIIVASVNLVVGAIIGAIEGYYGGKIDLIMERIIDILASIPFMIVITLLKYHLNASHVIILFISFFLTGWTSMAARTRMQFYRFKNQEYVLVARTLGASDARIMFKHIFPNAIGTLITSCVLVIPGVIFSETSLSYLGIINLESGNLISVGTLLGKGTANVLFNTPHVVLFPSLFISLLMLSFNLFGNGLRDAFNPSLRGMEE